MPIITDPAAATGLPEPNRRGFLRGLTTLPLIGGGVTLIGAPTAVASPVTTELLTNYETWLNIEAARVASERDRNASGTITTFYTPAWHWHDADRELARPSSRAALVLAAVGCDWRAGR